MSDTQKLTDLVATLETLALRRRTRAIDFFNPYPKQEQFFAAGATHRERLLMAGNQQGKSYAGAYETACHLTGEYPDWWKGRRFSHAPRGWAAGESGSVVRNVSQAKLCGQPGIDSAFGTGFIPRAAFAGKPTLAKGTADAYDTIFVQHKSGGVASLSFKSYEQGRTKLQGEGIDFIWLDEEPDAAIYSECLARITATNGMLYTTFTPLKGMSTVVLRFMNEASPDRWFVTMTIDDATHIDADKRAAIIAGYRPHEREARARGIPMLGEGKVFTMPHAAIIEPTIENVPKHWWKLWGLDFGIGHPFAAALCAWDKDYDQFHVLHTIRMADALPLQHTAAMKPVGYGVPCAWPRDGTNRDPGSGTPLMARYKAQGLTMMPDPATWPDGSVSTETGIMEMQERMETNRFKVAAHCKDWFEEYDIYHRDKGLIVKVKDDLMSATRIAIMMKRFAKQVLLGSHRSARAARIADDIDFDLS